MAKMFLMCGHPGSGKSTYAKQFAKLNGFRYLSIDDMYACFNGDPTSHDNKFDVWITFFRQIHAAEVAGQDVVIDTNAPARSDRDEFLNWFSSFDHYLIWIDAEPRLCLDNNKNRSRVIPEKQMQKIFELFEIPRRGEYYDELHITRSHWKGIMWVHNVNNTFVTSHFLFGSSFPSNIKRLEINGKEI